MYNGCQLVTASGGLLLEERTSELLPLPWVYLACSVERFPAESAKVIACDKFLSWLPFFPPFVKRACFKYLCCCFQFVFN
jgi:hypothetical protein